MTIIELTPIVFAVSVAAGCLGAMTGLGGGIILTPALSLWLGVDMRYAMGASLVSVIATSSGAAATYVRQGYSNIRIGMFLEIATTAGAVLGAILATHMSASWLAFVLGCVLLHTGWQSFRSRDQPASVGAVDSKASSLGLHGHYPTPEGLVSYHPRNISIGFFFMAAAGLLSGMLGIGSGALKVIAMDRAMRLPFKVSTATSTFMIGVTAAASAGVYFSRGYINPIIAMPVMLGVLSGSRVGAKLLIEGGTRYLRIVFAVVVLAVGIDLIWHGFLMR